MPFLRLHALRFVRATPKTDANVCFGVFRAPPSMVAPSVLLTGLRVLSTAYWVL